MAHYDAFGWTGPTATELERQTPPSWTGANRNAAKSILESLRKARTPQGWPVTHDLYTSFQCLAGLADNPTKYHLHDLIQAVKFLPSPCSDDVVYLERALRAWEDFGARERNSHARTWLFAVPANITLEKTTFPFRRTLQNVEVVLVPASMIAVAATEHGLSVAGILIPTLETTDASHVAICAGSGANSTLAWNNGPGPVLEVLRACVEFAAGVMSTHISSRQLICRQRLPLPDHIFVSDAGQAWTHEDMTRKFPAAEFQPDALALGPSRIELLDDLLEAMGEAWEAGSLSEIIADAIRLYGLAIDQLTDYTFLLHLWQVAERICLSEDVGGNTAQIAKRLSLIVADHNTNLEGLLPAIQRAAQFRNHIVHRGQHELPDRMLPNVFRWICEYAMFWLINAKSSLRTEAHLRTFFRRAVVQPVDRQLESEVDAFLNR